MFRALRFLIFLGLLTGAVVWLANRPGVVTLSWLGWRADTSVALLIALIAAVGVAVALLYRFWLFFRRAPKRIVRAYGDNRRRRGYLALTRGMVAVAAGDAEEAAKQAGRANGLLSDPPLTMLLSAQAAQLKGDEAAAADFFTAMLEKPETEFLGLRGLLTQALKQGDRARSLKLAERAYRIRPASGWVAANLFDLQVQNGDWPAAANTLKRSVKNKLIDRREAKRREAVLAFEESRRALDEGDNNKALRLTRKAHKSAPGFQPAAVALARALVETGSLGRAARAIEQAWGREPHPDFDELYFKARKAADPLARLKAAKRLATFRADHEESGIIVAEAALAAEIWGEARNSLRPLSNAPVPSRRVCKLMARLEESEHGDEKKSHEWLIRAAGAADPAWVCSECGNSVGGWSLLCGKCGGFDTYRWGAPPHIAGAAAPEVIPPSRSGLDLVDGRRPEQ
jgi:HemY protein